MIMIDAQLARGVCPVHIFGATDDRSRPIILFFMDGFGPRPALFDMGERLAQEGYRVLLPHLFYDHLPSPPIEPQSVLSGGEDKARLMTMLAKLDQSAVEADVRALLGFADAQLGDEAPIGATGYCMGGRYALTAATLNSRVKMAASFHGATLAPEQGDSAHHHLSGVKAKVYIGVAGLDAGFSGAEEGRLAAALRDAQVEHAIEIYADAKHGFALHDLPMHHEGAARRHWSRLTTGLQEAFAR